MGDIIDFEEKKLKVEKRNQEIKNRKKQNEKVIRKVKNKNKFLKTNVIKYYILILVLVSAYVIFIK